MGVDEEFERVRATLRVEEQALAQEFDHIDAEARAAVDESIGHVRAELATQADRIREAIAQQREEVEAHNAEVRAQLEAETPPVGEWADDVPADDAVPADEGVEQVAAAQDEPGDTIGDVERGD